MRCAQGPVENSLIHFGATPRTPLAALAGRVLPIAQELRLRVQPTPGGVVRYLRERLPDIVMALAHSAGFHTCSLPRRTG